MWNKLQWNFNRYSYIFIQENSFENVVCEISAILSRPQCVQYDDHGMEMLYTLVAIYEGIKVKYRKFSNIRRTKYQNLNASRLIL